MNREELINFGERFLKMTKDSKDSISYQFFEEALTLFKQEPCTLDDAREDFMHDIYNVLDFLPTNEEANKIIDIFDRVTSGLQQNTVNGLSLDKVKQAFINKYPKNYMGEPELGGRTCYFSLNEVLEILESEGDCK